jgi:alpha-L-fucosidase 2
MMRNELDRQYEDLRNTLTMLSPASWHGDSWRDASPIGNGVLGGLVFGQLARETILINHSALWHRSHATPLPDINYTLAETRRLMDEGKYHEANWVSSNELRKSGYKNSMGAPLPLCSLKLNMGEREPFSHYRRTVDMATAEAVVMWNEGGKSIKRRAFISRSNEALVFRIDSDHPIKKLELSLALHDTLEVDTEKVKEELTNIQTICERNFQYYAACIDGQDFGAVMTIQTDGIVSHGQDGLTVERGKSCAAYVKFFIHAPREESWKKLKSSLELMEKDYEKLLDKHTELHKPLYQSADFEISEKWDTPNELLLLDAYEGEASLELLEKLWRYGRYLMVCGTRDDGLPFPLYGVWPGRYSLPWVHNMANENLQMIYWHIEAGNMVEFLRPVIRYYNSKLQYFRENANKLFGLDGIFIPAGTTPVCSLPCQLVPVIMNWVGAAGWLSRHFYTYYLFSKDEAFFKTEIWPFLREAAVFYSGYIVEQADGCKIYPSISPENTPGNLILKGYEDLAHPCPSVVNATIDIAIIKELLSIVAAEGTRMGESAETVSTWLRIKNKLPAYETTDEGAIREWVYAGLDERYAHRHLSHIYPVFPGDEFVAGRDNDMLDAFKLAVDKRVLGSQTGWSFAHMSCVYSRLERGEKALECIDNLSRSCLTNNLFTLHNDWRNMGLTLERGLFAPVQLDANMGIVNALQEMIFYCGKNYIRFLPALPNRLVKGKVKDFAFPGGHVSFEWNKSKMYFKAEITADRDISLKASLPWGMTHFIHCCGQVTAEDGVIDVKLSVNEKIMIVSQ